ncbi:MAG TPA: YbhB/YbcL family Raf kinase inhibitor-like protein [bacterium]|jgi:hypothetical protein
MKIQSSSFTDWAKISNRHSYNHTNLSPPLNWTNVPDGTVELALICDDPDCPTGTFIHWVIWGIPASAHELPEGMPKELELPAYGSIKQGKNDFGLIGWDGPAPPPGKNHRYYFKLYALSESVDPGPMATASQLIKSMEGKILAEADCMGTYQV